MTAQERRQDLSRGFTLLEIVTALALAALVFAASFPALKAGASAKRKTEAGLAAEIDALFIQALIEKAAARAAGICFFPGIFVAGKDGAPVDRERGEAAGFIIPAPALAFHPPDAGPFDGRLICAHRPWSGTIDPAALSDIKAWLGVSVDGFQILGGTIRRVGKNPPACSGETGYLADLSPDRRLNAFVSAGGSALRQQHLLYMPIEDGFVISADQDGVLRRKSITSKENAPLIQAVERFEFERQDQSKYKFSLKIKNAALKTFTVTIPAECRTYQWLG